MSAAVTTLRPAATPENVARLLSLHRERMATRPTKSPPGSPAKLDVLQARAERNLPLFQPRDDGRAMPRRARDERNGTR